MENWRRGLRSAETRGRRGRPAWGRGCAAALPAGVSRVRTGFALRLPRPGRARRSAP